ncbi:MAG: 4Fe-4S binding protein [Pseudomonadota bacterium]
MTTRSGWRQVRRLSQVLSLLLWIALFLWVRDPVASPLRTDLFLISDPLVALLTMGSALVWVPTLLGSLVLVVMTLVVGRAFCGWLCPLGTLLDGMARVLRPPESRFSLAQHQRMQHWKYVLLTVVVIGALLSSQWIYLLDPLVLLFRATAGGLWPAFTAVLPDDALPGTWHTPYHGIAFLPLALLLTVLGLTALSPRFYCRYLCPLGAFYGLLARVPLLRRRVKGCDGCHALAAGKQCIRECRMGAVPSNPQFTLNHECIRCMSGRDFCHVQAIRFDWMSPGRHKVDRPLELGRRSFLVAGATGVALAPLTAFAAYHRGDPNTLVRPPRVLDEDTFLDQCVRCGMCVQACPTQTLQLTHLEAGLAGLWTPAITPEVGGCRADCNACGEVCPSDAIPRFDKRETDKWSVKMGTAVLEKDRCISYTDNLACRKCIEICPTKAFVIEAARPDRPLRPAAVDYVRCMGCGLCENACRKIVYGEPALKTFAHGRGQPTVLRERPTPSFTPPVRE